MKPLVGRRFRLASCDVDGRVFQVTMTSPTTVWFYDPASDADRFARRLPYQQFSRHVYKGRLIEADAPLSRTKEAGQ